MKIETLLSADRDPKFVLLFKKKPSGEESGLVGTGTCWQISFFGKTN